MVRSLVRNFIIAAVPKDSIKETEIDAVIELCSMPINPTKQNPRQLASQLSDFLLTHIVSKASELNNNTAFSRVMQIFIIEWCYRNGYLLSDWHWQWISQNEGTLHYQPRIPIDQVPLP